MFSKFDIKKVSLWIFIIMMCSFAIATSILLVKGSNNTLFSQGKESGSQDINIEKTFSVGDIKDINVDTISTSVNIIPVETNEIKAHFYGNVSGSKDSIPEFIAEQKNSSLSIQVKHKIKFSIGINFHFDNIKLDIYIPKSYLGDLKIDTVSGSAEIAGLNLNKLGFNSTSGSLEASSLNTKDTSIGTTSGSANLKGYTGNLTFNSTSGSLKAEYPAFNNKIIVDTTSGSAKIKLPENAEFNVNFSATSGEFRSDFPIADKGSRAKHDFKGSIGNSQNNITVDSTSGSLEIEK